MYVQGCIGVISGFLYVYLASLGAPTLLVGACLVMTCVTELPTFMFSGRILARTGYRGALDIGLCAFCLRLAAYSTINFAPSVWFVVPVEALHAATWGVPWTAAVNFCKSEAPPGLASSAQGLFTAVLGGLGQGTGGLVGGLLYNFYGGAFLFRATLAFVATASAAIMIVERGCKL
jgi:MFS transporter, PPP family, 3-phenylpropionic acid transporter